MVEKKTSKKKILVMSSHPVIMGLTVDDGQMTPTVLKTYDFSKGGTDVMDPKIRYHTTNTKSRRWTLTAFSYV